MIKTQKKYILILSILAISIITIGAFYHYNLKDEIIQDEINDMDHMLGLYVSEIENWLLDKKTDSEKMLLLPRVIKNVKALLTNKGKINKSKVKELLSTFEILRHHLEFRRIMLLNTKLESVLSTSSTIKTYQDEIKRAKKILDFTKPSFSKIHLQDKTKELEIDLFLPIFDGKGKKKKLIGLFVAELDPYEILNSQLIMPLHLKSKTTECIVTYEKDNDKGEIVVINKRRNLKNEPLRFTFNTINSSASFYNFLKKENKYYSGEDYRSKDIIAVKRFIPDVKWNVIYKKDKDEILADLNNKSIILSGLFLSLFLAAGFVLSSVAKKRQAEFYRIKYILESEKRDVEKELIKNEKRLREAQKVAKLASWSRDLTNGNFYCSDEFYILLGYEKDQVETSYESFLKILDPDDAEILVKKNEENKKLGGEPFEINVRYYNSKKELKYGQIKVGYEKNDENVIIKVTGTFQDITERMKNSEKLKKYSEELEEANITKDKFFSIIAHDLKSPFHGLLGYTSILVSDYASMPEEEKLVIINSIDEISQNAYALLEDLLTWSRLQTDKMEVNLESFILYEHLLPTLSLLTKTAVNKNVKLINEIDKKVFVKADKNMLCTIVRNLISNAIKFSYNDGKIIFSSKKKNNFLELSVKDTGIGIEKERLEKLFAVGKSNSTKGTENEPGTGLGLLLCKEMIEKLNGSILVESKIGNGSNFIFTVPLDI